MATRKMQVSARFRDQLFEIGGRIRQLRVSISRDQKELKHLEYRFDELLRQQSGDSRTLNDRVALFLDNHPGAEFDAGSVTEGLGEDTNIVAVRSALSRLARDGRVAETGSGTYVSTKDPLPVEVGGLAEAAAPEEGNGEIGPR